MRLFSSDLACLAFLNRVLETARHVDKPSFVNVSFVKDAQHLNKPEVSYPVAVRFQ